MKTKYIKIRLGEPNNDKEIFVREEDHIEMKKALKGKKSDRIVKATLNMLVGSPDGMNDLSESMIVWSFIYKSKNVKVLKNFRDIINYHIKKLNNETKKK